MIIGIGIDILEKYRIKNIKKLYNDKFSKKILNNVEINNLKKNNTTEHLSKTFTIKESIVKAIGTGFRNGLSFKNIIINNNLLGKPFINQKNPHLKLLITISHEKNITIALTIIIKLFKLD